MKILCVEKILTFCYCSVKRPMGYTDFAGRTDILNLDGLLMGSPAGQRPHILQSKDCFFFADMLLVKVSIPIF